VPEGRVEVTWSYAAGGRLILHWIESGGPSVNKLVHEGFGTSIIQGMLGELKGEIQRDWRAQGLACQFVLQL
jgi:two-component sensor histidine kinase